MEFVFKSVFNFKIGRDWFIGQMVLDQMMWQQRNLILPDFKIENRYRSNFYWVAKGNLQDGAAKHFIAVIDNDMLYASGYATCAQSYPCQHCRAGAG